MITAISLHVDKTNEDRIQVDPRFDNNGDPQFDDYIHDDYVQYRNEEGGNDMLTNDIALLQLTNRLNFAVGRVWPANLPENRLPNLGVNRRVRLAGWGRTNNEPIQRTDRLLYGDMTVIEQYWCGYFLNKFQDYTVKHQGFTLQQIIQWLRYNTPYSVWRSLNGIDDNQWFRNRQLCVGYTDDRQHRRTASAVGDSGGGLFLANDRGLSKTVYGVLSLGSSYRERDGFLDGPVVYTRVSFYVGWIQGKITQANRD